VELAPRGAGPEGVGRRHLLEPGVELLEPRQVLVLVLGSARLGFPAPLLESRARLPEALLERCDVVTGPGRVPAALQRLSLLRRWQR